MVYGISCRLIDFGIFGNLGLLAGNFRRFIPKLSKLSKLSLPYLYFCRRSVFASALSCLFKKIGPGTAAGDVANSGGGSRSVQSYASCLNFSVPFSSVNFQFAHAVSPPTAVS